LGQVEKLLADRGHYSKANVRACPAEAVEPYIPEGRQEHNLPLAGRFAPDPVAPSEPTEVEAMRHRLKTREGKAICARRKSTVETVFGIIKQGLGFRQLLLRGVGAGGGE